MVQYFNGDLLASGCEVICHQTNCMGAMGGGIARQIRAVFPEAYQALRERFENGQAKLGECDFVEIDRKDPEDPFLTHDYIVNCYSQFDYLPRGVRHTDYDAFRTCCKKIKERFEGKNFRIGFPYKIGSALGGGDWEVMKQIIEEEFKDNNWRVEVWQLSC